MRVYGLKSSVKSLGWLVGVIFFGLAALYPPVPGVSLYLNSPLNSAFFGWQANVPYVLATGGIVWHILSYLHWQSSAGAPYWPTFANAPWTDRALITEFSPYCFVPVTLPLCAVILWRRLVNYAERPTIMRGVLAALLALISSLGLIFLLDWVGGRVMLHIISISLTGNIEVRNLISVIWITAIIQSVLLSLPCLVIGGLLAWRQGYLEARSRATRRVASVAGQQPDLSEKIV